MWSIWKYSSFKILSLIPNHIASRLCQKYIKFLRNPVQFLCRRTVSFTLFNLVRLFIVSIRLGQLYFQSHQHQNKHHFPDKVSGHSPFNVSNQTAVLMLFLLFPNPLPTFHITFKGSLSVVPCETFLHHLTECPQSSDLPSLQSLSFMFTFAKSTTVSLWMQWNCSFINQYQYFTCGLSLEKWNDRGCHNTG